MSEWKEMELGDFVELKRGYDLPKKKREPGEVPLISSSGESDFHSEAKVKGPGVVTGRYGTIGEVFYVEDDFWPLNTTLYVKDFKGNDPLFVYYFLKTISYSDYSDKAAVPGINRNHLHKAIIHVPVDPIYQRELAEKLWALDTKIELNRQTNQTLEHIAQAIFKSWFVDFEPTRAKAQVRASVAEGRMPGSDQNLPPGFSKEDEERLVERAAMAAISGKSLDELDQLTPEQQEQLLTTAALFPDTLDESELGEIPEGWKVAGIKELSSKISKGTTPRKAEVQNVEDKEIIPFLKVRDISDYGEITRTGLDCIPESIHSGVLKRSMLEANDVLFSIAGTIGRVAVVEEDLSNSNCNQAIAFIRLEEPDQHLQLCRLNLVGNRVQDEVISKVVQGVQANFSLTGLGEIKIIIPSEDILTGFNKTINDISDEQKSLLNENRKLSKLRDSLLPKLLSGELPIITDKAAVC